MERLNMRHIAGRLQRCRLYCLCVGHVACRWARLHYRRGRLNRSTRPQGCCAAHASGWAHKTRKAPRRCTCNVCIIAIPRIPAGVDTVIIHRAWQEQWAHHDRDGCRCGEGSWDVERGGVGLLFAVGGELEAGLRHPAADLRGKTRRWRRGRPLYTSRNRLLHYLLHRRRPISPGNCWPATHAPSLSTYCHKHSQKSLTAEEVLSLKTTDHRERGQMWHL